MGLLIRLAELLVVMLPLIGVLYVGIKALSSFTRRLGEASGDLASDSPAMPRPTTVENDAARWRAITRAVEAHERTDARWLEYELDAAKLLDFPVMTTCGTRSRRHFTRPSYKPTFTSRCGRKIFSTTRTPRATISMRFGTM